MSNLIIFTKRFMDEEKCYEYLKEQRFKNGVHCLICGGRKIREPKKYDERYYCADCNRLFSLKKGMPFERSKLPLTKWFLAIYLMLTSSKGISSIQLGKQIGVMQKL